MIIIIRGQTHCGKTYLAQKLLEKFYYPYLSIDHIKMGLIRTNNTSLTPNSSELELTSYLWPIIREIIKTNIENKQNLIIEGVYIPCLINNEFSEDYLRNIKFINIVFSESYIRNNFDLIISKSNVIENRIVNDEINIDYLIDSNKKNLFECIKNNVDYFLVNSVEDFHGIIDLINP